MLVGQQEVIVCTGPEVGETGKKAGKEEEEEAEGSWEGLVGEAGARGRVRVELSGLKTVAGGRDSLLSLSVRNSSGVRVSPPCVQSPLVPPVGSLKSLSPNPNPLGRPKQLTNPKVVLVRSLFTPSSPVPLSTHASTLVTLTDAHYQLEPGADCTVHFDLAFPAGLTTTTAGREARGLFEVRGEIRVELGTGKTGSVAQSLVMVSFHPSG